MPHTPSFSYQEVRMGQKVSSVAAATAANHKMAEESSIFTRQPFGQDVSRSDLSDADEPTRLQQENDRLKSDLETAFAELRELEKRNQRFKQSAEDDRDARKHLEQACRDLESACNNLGEERDDYRERLAVLTARYEEAQKFRHEAKKSLENEDPEKRKLQEQVAQFKKLISSSSHMENQVADDVIRARSDQIFYSIQDFVVRHFRGVQFDFARIGEPSKYIMQELAPLGDKLPRSLWLNLINSLISWVMTDSFKPRNMFGVSRKTPVVAAQELASAFKAKLDPKWVTITRKLLSETADGLLHTSDQRLAEQLSKSIQHDLRRAVSVEWTTEMHNQLAEIFKRAQEFYRLLYSQQSQLKLVMPKAIVNGEPYPFMPESMEEVNGVLDDETELRGTPIEITVFPAVCKTPASSDATGGAMTVVAKAKVVVRS